MMNCRNAAAKRRIISSIVLHRRTSWSQPLHSQTRLDDRCSRRSTSSRSSVMVTVTVNGHGHSHGYRSQSQSSVTVMVIVTVIGHRYRRHFSCDIEIPPVTNLSESSRALADKNRMMGSGRALQRACEACTTLHCTSWVQSLRITSQPKSPLSSCDDAKEKLHRHTSWSQ